MLPIYGAAHRVRGAQNFPHGAESGKVARNWRQDFPHSARSDEVAKTTLHLGDIGQPLPNQIGVNVQAPLKDK